MTTILITSLIYLISIAFLRWVTGNIQEVQIDDNLSFKGKVKRQYTSTDYFLIYTPVVNTIVGLWCLCGTYVLLLSSYFKKRKK